MPAPRRRLIADAPRDGTRLRLWGKPGTEPFTGDDPLRFVISFNLHRRHLDESQRAMIADRLATGTWGGRRSKAPIGGLTQDDAAAALNVGARAVQRARMVRSNGIPELVARVERGEVAVSVAAQIATLTPERQLAAVHERPAVLRGSPAVPFSPSSY